MTILFEVTHLFILIKLQVDREVSEHKDNQQQVDDSQQGMYP